MLCHAAGSSARGIAWDRSAANYSADSTGQCKRTRKLGNKQAADIRAITLLVELPDLQFVEATIVAPCKYVITLMFSHVGAGVTGLLCKAP